MPTAHEQFSERFYAWERRGRGWTAFPEPVLPEPPFIPFPGYYAYPHVELEDDGSRPSFLASLVQGLGRKRTEGQAPAPEVAEEPEPTFFSRDSIVELPTSLPVDFDTPREAFGPVISNLTLCREPIAFELVGGFGSVTAQFAASENDAWRLRRQLQAHFPDPLFQPREETLATAWHSCGGEEALIVEFGLANEFMLPLATGKHDPFVGIVGSLSELAAGELAMLQVLFQAVQGGWPESIMRAVAHPDGKPFFIDRPDLTASAREKLEFPLFAAVVRIAVRSEDFERTVEIAQEMAGSLRAFASPNGNELVPLQNHDYPLDEHVEDLLRRQSRRLGMLLNSEEVIGFVHLPSADVRSPVFKRATTKTKAAPNIVRQEHGLLLGNNVHAGQTVPVRLNASQRTMHTHIIGASGTGKSTLLFNLIRQDIESGQGLAVLDPHGDLVDRILGIIPEHRIDDVIYIDPADEEFSIAFNILSSHSEQEKSLLASDLVSVFQRLSTSWGDQMGSVLSNAVLAFLESKRGGTLADLRRFLIEPAFRAQFLTTIDDANLLYYWQKGFPQLSGNKSIGPVLTRLDSFLAQKPIRYMVCQKENRLDFGGIMDGGKILLAKLSQGLLGKENSFLLGSLLVSKFQQLAMARQAQQRAARRDFWIYLDEFHNFITASMAEILAGARKYRIGMVLAHQELRQLQRDSEVASAVLTNPYTRIVFRVGDDDAKKLAEGFSTFEARDLQNLETGQAIARVERRDFDFNLSVPFDAENDEAAEAQRRQEVATASREKYGTSRAAVEADLRRMNEIPELQKKASKPPPPPQATATTTAAQYTAPPVVAPTPASPPAVPIPLPSSPQAHARAMPPAPVTQSPAPPEVTVSGKKASAQPADLGRGGAQHKAIQSRIKEAAEKVGFHCVIEHPVLDGDGSVDLLLERADKRIACEISITTPIDHEVKNVIKCLKAGFSVVAIVCIDESRLKRIESAVAGSLGHERAAQVAYYHPDSFISSLVPPPLPPSPTAPSLPTERRGYKIKRSVSDKSPETLKARDKAAIQSILELMKSKEPPRL